MYHSRNLSILSLHSRKLAIIPASDPVRPTHPSYPQGTGPGNLSAVSRCNVRLAKFDAGAEERRERGKVEREGRVSATIEARSMSDFGCDDRGTG